MASGLETRSSTCGSRTPPTPSNFLNDAMTEEQALHQIAQKYRDEGYTVLLRPMGENRPEFAKDLEIDMIAHKGDQHVVVEVKRKRKDLADDPRASRLAEI